MNIKKTSVESYFLKYAFPCTYVIKRRGDIDEKTFRKLEKAALKGLKVERKLLESTYKKAFERLRRVAADMGKKDYWSLDVVREYFINRHNSMIDIGDGNYATAPEILKELCKVVKSEIIEKRNDFFIVKYGSHGKKKTRVVGSFFVPNAKIGDKVMIHHGYAVEMAE